MEEGELSEPGFEDLYEPYLEPDEEKTTAGGASQQESTDDEDYDPANNASPIAPQPTDRTWPDQTPAAEPEDEGRWLFMCGHACGSLLGSISS